MKRFLPLSITVSLMMLSFNMSAQYCTPPDFLSGPYTFMSNITLLNLNQSSVYPTSVGYVYYSSANVPQLEQGLSIPISVTANDGNIMGMEIRIWIDYNGDGTFNPTSELAASWSPTSSGTITHTANIAIPAGATLGTTRMRVYCDMPVAGGHPAATPCGYSSGIGQHGEVEDYDVEITSSVGINEINADNGLILYPNPSTGIINIKLSDDFDLQHAVLYDVTGKEVLTVSTTQIDASQLPKGLYFVKVVDRNNGVTIQKITIQ